jgi:WD40 repeat protein
MQRYALLYLLILGSLGFARESSAQQRCGDLFGDEQSVINELARLKVDSEASSSSSIRTALNKDFTRKKQLAFKSGINLESLNQRIEELRSGKKSKDQEDRERTQKLKEQEDQALGVTYRPLKILPGESKYEKLKFIDNDSKFFAADSFKSSIFDAHTGDLIKTFPFSAVAISDDGKLVFHEYTYSLDGSWKTRIDIHNVDTGEKIRISPSNSKELYVFKISPDGRFALGRQEDALPYRVILWDTETGAEIKRFEYDRHLMNKKVIISPNGNFILAASQEGHLEVLDTQSFSTVAKLSPNRKFENMTFTPDSRKILLEDGRRKMMVWDLDTNQTLPVLNLSNRIASHPGGRLIFSFGGYQVDIFSSGTLTQLGTFEPEKPAVNALAVSQDETHLIANSSGPSGLGSSSTVIWERVTKP